MGLMFVLFIAFLIFLAIVTFFCGCIWVVDSALKDGNLWDSWSLGDIIINAFSNSDVYSAAFSLLGVSTFISLPASLLLAFAVALSFVNFFIKPQLVRIAVKESTKELTKELELAQEEARRITRFAEQTYADAVQKKELARSQIDSYYQNVLDMKSDVLEAQEKMKDFSVRNSHMKLEIARLQELIQKKHGELTRLRRDVLIRKKVINQLIEQGITDRAKIKEIKNQILPGILLLEAEIRQSNKEKNEKKTVVFEDMPLTFE